MLSMLVNKGDDQLCGYYTADHCLCFCICKKPVLLMMQIICKNILIRFSTNSSSCWLN